MRGDLIRILSDVHFGDRASLVRRLAQLRPLITDVSAVVFNGDTLDTRTGPHARFTAQCREQVLEFTPQASGPVTLLTGNHDPDLSNEHSLDLANGQVFVVHGDILFDTIVPWGRDAQTIRSKLAEALGANPATTLSKMTLDERLNLWRTVARNVPQRHQSEQNPFKYGVRFLADTVWPPNRFFKIFDAWRDEPHLAEQLIQQYRPNARFVLLGHTHRPRIRHTPSGVITINTGSFTAPFGGFCVDLSPSILRVRRVEKLRNEFRPGPVVAEFPLATA